MLHLFYKAIKTYYKTVYNFLNILEDLILEVIFFKFYLIFQKQIRNLIIIRLAKYKFTPSNYNFRSKNSISLFNSYKYKKIEK